MFRAVQTTSVTCAFTKRCFHGFITSQSLFKASVLFAFSTKHCFHSFLCSQADHTTRQTHAVLTEDCFHAFSRSQPTSQSLFNTLPSLSITLTVSLFASQTSRPHCHSLPSLNTAISSLFPAMHSLPLRSRKHDHPPPQPQSLHRLITLVQPRLAKYM